MKVTNSFANYSCFVWISYLIDILDKNTLVYQTIFALQIKNSALNDEI